MVKHLVGVAIALALSTSAVAGELGIKPIDISTMDPQILEQARQAVRDGESARQQISETETRWIERLASQSPVQPEQLQGPVTPSSPAKTSAG